MTSKLEVSVGWRRRPLSLEETARRAVDMLTSLQSIEERFQDFMEGGRSPSLASGWRPLPVSQEAVEEALRRSDRASAKRGYKGTPRRDFGAWNGHKDDGTSVAVGFVVEGIGPPSGVDLRSS